MSYWLNERTGSEIYGDYCPECGAGIDTDDDNKGSDWQVSEFDERVRCCGSNSYRCHERHVDLVEEMQGYVEDVKYAKENPAWVEAHPEWVKEFGEWVEENEAWLKANVPSLLDNEFQPMGEK